MIPRREVFCVAAIVAGIVGCQSATRPQAVSDQNDATKAATIATVGFIAGGALLAAGAVLFFTAPVATESAPARGAVRVAASAGPGSAGSWLQGTF